MQFKYIFKKLIKGSILILIIFALILAIKGERGNPLYYQTELDKRLGGPYEVSNSTSRYALVLAIAENGRFDFDKQQAILSGGDLIYYKNKFFSVFTPGISFLGLPFYLIGRHFGYPQLFTYSVSAILAIFNLFLVFQLAKKWGTGFWGALFCGFIFLFGTNSLSYALTFTQHEASTAVILMAILNAFEKRTLMKNIELGVLLGFGILFDIPNALLMLPVIIYIIIQHIQIHKSAKSIGISFKFNILAVLIGLLPFVAIFGWYNYKTTGSYIKYAQSFSRTKIDDTGNIIPNTESNNDSKSHVLVYNTRNQTEGLYILLLSSTRSWLIYSPVVFLGIFGLWFVYKSGANRQLLIVAISVALLTIVSYSMFGDPWGGMAFGPRYLIPAAAIFTSGLGIMVKKWSKKPLFLLLILFISAYSIGVNLLGAITTAHIYRIPEFQHSILIPNNYLYNWQLLNRGLNTSLIYNLFISPYLNPKLFFFLYLFFVWEIFLFIFAFTLKNLEK